MIRLVNVTKDYGSDENVVHALNDVNLIIEDGKLTSIVGKSGSGKTTLMNLIGTLDFPTSGKIYFDDVDVFSYSKNELADIRNKNIGFIFQGFYLESKFSVLENICMPLTIRGVSKKERETKAIELIDKLGLSDKINKKVSQLSGGQKQRVCIARALISDPKIILADEPTGNLDSQNGKEVIDILRKLANDGRTVILVTHNLEDAKLADNMIYINDGYVTANYMEKYEE
ncbi:MAG: ABC transporter ATP-binding protein [Anaeroplasma sp.]